MELVTHSKLLFNMLLICEVITVLKTIFQVDVRLLRNSSVGTGLMIISPLKMSKIVYKCCVQVEANLFLSSINRDNILMSAVLLNTHGTQYQKDEMFSYATLRQI